MWSHEQLLLPLATLISVVMSTTTHFVSVIHRNTQNKPMYFCGVIHTTDSLDAGG